MGIPYVEQDQTLLWTCVAGAHLQCVNNHYAKFEYKGMKFVSKITQFKPSKGGVDVILSKFNIPLKKSNCAQNIGKYRVHMFNMLLFITHKV